MDRPSPKAAGLARAGSARAPDWLAVFLELLPIAGIVLFFALIFGDDISDASWFIAIPLTASGFGWLKIGRVGTGCAIGILRALTLWGLGIVVLVAWFGVIFCGWEGDDSDCDDARAAIAFIASALAYCVVAFLLPIASAIMVARASRVSKQATVPDR